MKTILSAVALALAVFSTSTAQADCDTGFEMRTLIGQPHQEEIVFFQCTVGGLYGDPDLGWEMVHLVGTDGEEIRVLSRDAQKLLQVGIAVTTQVRK